MKKMMLLAQPQPAKSIRWLKGALTESLLINTENFSYADGEVFFGFNNFIVRDRGAFLLID